MKRLLQLLGFASLIALNEWLRQDVTAILAEPISMGVAALLGGSSLLGSLFGGSKRTEEKSRQQMMISPENQARINEALSGYQGNVSNLLQQIQQSQGALAGMPQAGERFQFTGAADPVTRAIAAQGQQDLLAQAAGARRQVMRQNPQVGGALSSILGMQSQLQQNPLMGQALQQQFARRLSEGQLQEQQLQNEIRNLFAREQLATNLGLSGAQAQLAGMSPLLDFIRMQSPVEMTGSARQRNVFGF